MTLALRRSTSGSGARVAAMVEQSFMGAAWWKLRVKLKAGLG